MPQPPLVTLPIPTVVEEPFQQRRGSISYYYNKYKEHLFETPKFKRGKIEQKIHLTKQTSNQGHSHEDEFVSLKPIRKFGKGHNQPSWLNDFVHVAEITKPMTFIEASKCKKWCTTTKCEMNIDKNKTSRVLLICFCQGSL
jgi:hypothetical protein